MSVQAIAMSLKAEGLKPSEKLLLLALANYADDKMKCWPSHKTLAADTGLSQRTILTTFKKLEAAGLLTRTPRERPDGSRASDIITLNLGGEMVAPRGETVAPPVGKPLRRGGEMVAPLTSFEPSKEPKKSDEDLAEAVWQEANQDSRNRSGRQYTRTAVAAALAKGATPESLLASVRNHCRKSGEHAKGLHRIIEGELWRDCMAATKVRPPSTADPAYRAYCEAHWRATGEWKPEWGEKPRQAA